MKKIILIIVCFLVLSFFLWTTVLWKIFKSNIAGSYTHAETWSLNVKEDSLIKIINEIKKEHPELEPPNASYPTSGKESFWYEFLFYYANTNENVQTLIRSNEDSSYTTLYFVAIATHIDSLTDIKHAILYRKEINKDFGYFENRRQIKKFEDSILDLIIGKLPSSEQSTHR